MTDLPSAGFPHSDISGSLPICGSPKLFAAYHVFHRLSVPRHPPCALLCLTFVQQYQTTCCILLLINIALLINSITKTLFWFPIIAWIMTSILSNQCLDVCFSVFDFQGTNLRSKVLRNSNEEACTLSGLSPVLCGSLEVVWSFAVIVAFSFNWAEEDSNFRPHAYQACALTG